MGQSTPFPRQPETAGHLFLVGRWREGFWVARDLEGSAEGIFRDKKEAIRFAMSEGGHPNAVMLSPNAVEPSFGRGVR
jgi:hypothetical protein